MQKMVRFRRIFQLIRMIHKRYFSEHNFLSLDLAILQFRLTFFALTILLIRLRKESHR